MLLQTRLSARQVEGSQQIAAPASLAIGAGVTIAALFLLSRRGLDAAHLPVIVGFLCLLALIGSVALATEAAARWRLAATHWIALAGVAATGAPIAALWLGRWPVLLCLAALAFSSLRVLRRFSLDNLLGVLLGAVFGFALFIWINAAGYAHVWAREFLLLQGGGHDLLFHSSLATMLKHFDVSSTGLSGFVPFIWYYVFSHLVVAGASVIADVTPLEMYPPAQQVFFIPSLLFAIAYAGTSIGARLGGGSFAASCLPVVLVAVTSAFVWDSWLYSESYTASLVLFMLASPVLFGPLGASWSHRGWAGAGWAVTLLIVLVALFFAKPSVAFVSATLAGFSLLLAVTAGRRIVFSAIAFVLVVLGPFVVIATVGLWDPQGKVLAVTLFELPRQYPQEFYRSVGIILLALAIAPVLDPSRWGLAFAAVVAPTAVLSFIPSVLVSIPGGSGYYFYNPVLLIALIGVAQAAHHRWAESRTWAQRPISLAAAGATAALIVIAVVSDIRPWSCAGDLVNRAAIFRKLVGGDSTVRFSHASPYGQHCKGPAWVLDLPLIFSRHAENARSVLENSALARIRRAVERARSSSAPGERIAVFVDPEVKAYWGSHVICSAQAFVGPALFALPMLRSVPKRSENCVLRGYGFDKYGEDDTLAPMDERALCEFARARNFPTVVKVEQADPVRATLVRCGPA